MESQAPVQELSVDLQQKELIDALKQKQKEAVKKQKLTRRLSKGIKKLLTPRSAASSPRDAADLNKGFVVPDEAAAADSNTALLPSVPGSPAAADGEDTIPAVMSPAGEEVASSMVEPSQAESEAGEVEDEEEATSVAPILSPAPHTAKAVETTAESTADEAAVEITEVKAQNPQETRRPSGMLRFVLVVAVIAAAALGNASLQRSRTATRN